MYLFQTEQVTHCRGCYCFMHSRSLPLVILCNGSKVEHRTFIKDLGWMWGRDVEGNWYYSDCTHTCTPFLLTEALLNTV